MAVSNYMNVDILMGFGQFGDTVGPRVNGTASYSPNPIGMSVRARHNTGGQGAAFVFAQGSNVSSAGQFVHLVNGSAVLLASANSASQYQAGVAAAPLSATNLYGWVQIDGLCDYARGTNASIAAGVGLYPTATAGYVNSSGGTGNRIGGLVCPVSYTSSQSASMTVALQNPSQIWASNQ